MKRLLRWSALVLAIAAVTTWLATGAHRGWTQTEVSVKTLDEVTGLEGITTRPGFMAGVDFLGAALAVAGALAGLSVFFRNPNIPEQTQTLR